MPNNPPDPDIHHMKQALSAARRGLGRVWPNPSVGCVIVKNGHVIAKARTGNGGRPHAEVLALKKAGRQAKGATAYVTLEPCAHEGETPSCARLLVEEGVGRVVVACVDPDPRTAGQGVELFKQAGIEVHEGVCQQEALDLNKGFILRVTKNRPLVTLKCATSADGKMAMASGESKWITGEKARADVHKLRARHDAILTGIGTVLADDPQMTNRSKVSKNNPVRIVLDPKGKLPDDARIDPDIVLSDTYDLKAVLADLAERGLTRVLVEAGPRVLGSFLQAGLWDELHWYRAPKILGGKACDIASALDFDVLAEAIMLQPVKTRRLGEDLLEIYRRSG